MIIMTRGRLPKDAKANGHDRLMTIDARHIGAGVSQRHMQNKLSGLSFDKWCPPQLQRTGTRTLHSRSQAEGTCGDRPDHDVSEFSSAPSELCSVLRALCRCMPV